MEGMKIISPGFFTTVQDLGRLGYQKFGMAQAGAMDSFSLQLANTLVGNSPGAACLEITFIGPEIAFEKKAVVAITGADISPELNGVRITNNAAVVVISGDVLRFGALKSGCRAYVAFAGGLPVPLVMGSRSTYVKAGVGGYYGRALKEGDGMPLLDIEGRGIGNVYLTHYSAFEQKDIYSVHILPGPEAGCFSWKGIKTFLNTTFQISPESDRMGYRLSGPQIEAIPQTEMLSSGICNGTIQVPANGNPIILLADRQTTGGYPRIANVITADLSLLAQLKPGDCIKFKEVTMETALDKLKEKMESLKQISTAVSEQSQR